MAGVEVEVEGSRGRAALYECKYLWVCRQVVTDLSGRVGVFDVKGDEVHVTLVVSLQHSLFHRHFLTQLVQFKMFTKKSFDK